MLHVVAQRISLTPDTSVPLILPLHPLSVPLIQRA